jgi:uncharacterized membrane protein
MTQDGYFFLLRFVHFLAGITWIGVLYYFNFIQTPFFGTELGGTARSAMMRGLVPNALWWFRWGAMFTFLSGWTLVISHMVTGTGSMGYYALTLTGGAMGTLMWFNVWFVIWPIQKIAIASAEQVAGGGEAIPEAGARAPIAGRASRTNTLLSIPMLFFMGAARHFQSLNSADPQYAAYFIAAGVVILVIELNAFYGPGATQRVLGTVTSTITGGLLATLVLFLFASAML